MKPPFKILGIFTLFLFSFSAFADNAREGMRLFEAGKYQQAMTYFMKPDAQKNAEVLNHVGYMYDNGSGVKHSPELANQWDRKASGSSPSPSFPVFRTRQADIPALPLGVPNRAGTKTSATGDTVPS